MKTFPSLLLTLGQLEDDDDNEVFFFLTRGKEELLPLCVCGVLCCVVCSLFCVAFEQGAGPLVSARLRVCGSFTYVRVII